jgi:hypothetical protein
MNEYYSDEEGKIMMVGSDMIIDRNTNVFIYDNKEVKLTGRRAVKEIKSEGSSNKTDTLYEISPVDGPDWKVWTRLRELYKIEEY